MYYQSILLLIFVSPKLPLLLLVVHSFLLGLFSPAVSHSFLAFLLVFRCFFDISKT